MVTWQDKERVSGGEDELPAAERKIGTLRLSSKDDAWTVHCDALATHGYANVLYVASVAGPSTSIKAISAAMQCKKSIKMRPSDTGHRCWALDRYDGGYVCYKTKLGYATWQLLAVAKCDGLIRAMSDEALWQQMQTMHLTTPRLPEWTPWLRRRLEQEEMLVPLTSFGCEAALLSVTNDDLDRIVAEGLQCGELIIH